MTPQTHTADPALRLGVLDLCPLPRGGTRRDALFDTLEQAVYAEELGYSRYWLAEHHGRGTAHSSPTILAGQIAQLTHTIHVGTAGILLSYYSPLKVARDFQLLQALFPGRIDLGVGAGRVDEETARALLGSASPVPNYADQVNDLLAYQDDEETPDVWVLGSGGAGSANLAARNGTAYSLSLFLAGNKADPAVIETYRSTFRPSRSLVKPRWNVAVAGICEVSDAAAEQLARQHQNRFLVPTVVGSPRRCGEQLLDIAGRYETDEIIFLNLAPTRAQRLRGYQLLAEVLELHPAEADLVQRAAITA